MADETLDPSFDLTAQTKRSGGTLPANIGPYHILSLLGAGGMGEVYKAERRGPLRQVVALKIIKMGFDTREVVARFNSERHVLARMDDPHVARVLDAGVTDTGRPYFAMEYVPGVPITKFADDNKLSIKDRLLLFTQVCEAISHAHAKAIIHRDIKPSNVLAYMHDEKPTAKVIDFGIAKALTGDRPADSTFDTEMGRTVGTYDSMSPEQADASPDIDTRTDVYSLGVLLYELLVGVKPFDHDKLVSAADHEVRRIIREDDPPKPSTRLTTMGDTAIKIASSRRARLDQLSHDLRRELEWIPMKAMRKERDRRYATPHQLAEDIQNYLEHKPLLAGPESRAYRLRKFLRRNSQAVIATCAAAVLLGAGLGLYVHGIRAEQSKTAAALVEAQNQKQEADRQRDRAREQEREVKAQADSLSAVNQFLSDMIGSANPARLLGEKVTVLQAISAAIEELDRGQLAQQPLVEAAVRTTIGNTFSALGRYPDAQPQLLRALDIRRNMLPPNHPDIAITLNALATLRKAQGRPAEAEKLWRDALAIQRATLPPGHPYTLAIMNNLAVELQEEHKLDEAESLHREVLEIRRATLPAGNVAIAYSMNNLGTLLQARKKYEEAEQLDREALEMYRKARPPGHPDIARSLDNLATLLQEQHRLAEAEPLHREALAIRRAAFPANHPEIAGSLNNLAVLLQDEGKLSESEPLVRESLEIYRTTLPRGHPSIALAQGQLGTLLLAEGKYADAKANYRPALEVFRKVFHPGDLNIANAESGLGRALLEQGEIQEAEPLLRDAVNIRRKELGARAMPTTRSAAPLADLLDKTGRQDEAAALRNECGLPGPATNASR